MGRDHWTQAAKDFYGSRTKLSTDKDRFLIFTKAYGNLLRRFPEIKNASVLDLGCGSGYLGAAISQMASVTGIDISPDVLVLARQENPSVPFAAADATNLPFPSATFDFVFAMTSLEFCYEKEKVLREIRRMLRKGGNCYLEVRNADFPLYRLPGWVTRTAAKLNLFSPYQAEGFRDLQFKEWQSLIEGSGLKILGTYSSPRPWNYGGLQTRLKNLIIEFIKMILPVTRHYLVGFYCRNP